MSHHCERKNRHSRDHCRKSRKRHCRKIKKVDKLCANKANICKLNVKKLNVASECKQGINFDMTKNVDRLLDVVTSPREGGLPPSAPAAWSISCVGKDEHKAFRGVLNFDTQVPFDENSIIRIASESKFMGTVGYLKLLDQGHLTGFELLSDFIPEFANTEVLKSFTPTATVVLDNVITATNGSNVLNINEVAHGRSTGDVIGIEDATDVQGIPSSEINQVHVITVIDANNYTITVTTPATGTSPGGEGGLIKVQSLAVGVKRTS